ncbi:MAG: DUF2478 domain-containing protein [Rhizobiaceae bacterium]
MTQALLAAVRFGQNHDIDGFLERIAAAKLADGLRVRGALQSRGEANGECHCADMDLHLVNSGKVCRISQSLGHGSSGCRLHPGKLAECAAELELQVEAGCDLLIVNRFGKGESEGRGFRDLMSKAVLLGIPVLTATRDVYLDAWVTFSGDLGTQLSFDAMAVDEWIDNFIRLKAA